MAVEPFEGTPFGNALMGYFRILFLLWVPTVTHDTTVGVPQIFAVVSRGFRSAVESIVVYLDPFESESVGEFHHEQLQTQV